MLAVGGWLAIVGIVVGVGVFVVVAVVGAVWWFGCAPCVCGCGLGCLIGGG